MKTIKITNKNFREVVDEVAELIKSGKVVIFPTDTVYGLVCNANNKIAIDRIFKIKKRPKGKPISIFINSIKAVKKICFVNKEQEKFLKNIWPGAVTAILKPKKNIPQNVSQRKGTIGIRIPNYKFINQLISKRDILIAETSANISGEPATTKISEILKAFKNKKHQPDIIINAGNLPKNKPSMVIDLIVNPPKILRL